jgi:hypothetical protein
MIALTLTAPVLGLALVLTLHWFEERVMTTGASPVPVEPRG